MKPTMVVPDDARQAITSTSAPADVVLNLWDVLNAYIPDNYNTLRRNRPADHDDEMFVYTHSFQDSDEPNLWHAFVMFIDDASATDHLFLRDIQYVLQSL